MKTLNYNEIRSESYFVTGLGEVKTVKENLLGTFGEHDANIDLVATFRGSYELVWYTNCDKHGFKPWEDCDCDEKVEICQLIGWAGLLTAVKNAEVALDWYIDLAKEMKKYQEENNI